MSDRLIVLSPGNYNTRLVSYAAATRPRGLTRTVSSQKDEADINVLVKRFGIGIPLPPSGRVPSYGDFSDSVDFHQANNILVAAREAFMQQPADIRKKFGNDPWAFADFCQDPKNLPQMREMGLAEPEKVIVESPPLKVEVVNEGKDSKA